LSRAGDILRGPGDERCRPFCLSTVAFVAKRCCTMNLAHWTEVDRYITDLLVHPDRALETALQTSAEAGLPQINVAPNQGKFLQLLARIQGARHILEIGTLGGYSTIWLARALPPGGRLITLESEPTHAEVAHKNIAQAGLSEIVDLRLGPALDTL